MSANIASPIAVMATILTTTLAGNVALNTPATRAVKTFSVSTNTPVTQTETPVSEKSTTSSVYYYYDYDYGDTFLYPAYSFEQIVYLYIWEVLVILACLVNILVVSTLLRRRMRSVTNVILSAIAVSDSLTGLVTLPAYIMVYKSNGASSGYYIPTTEQVTVVTESAQPDVTLVEAQDTYVMTKTMCDIFMISKFFLSQSFHTVSVFLTLFLGVQRYVAVVYPYKSTLRTKKTLICCLIIFVVSPIIHTYHLGKEKAVDGFCQWRFDGADCETDCIYVWVLLFVRNVIPCIILSTVTGLFIKHLRSGETTVAEINNDALSERRKENRRVTKIVIAIVIGFLTPEVPYGCFLLYNAIGKLIKRGDVISLETNRMIHMCYEILLVLSFHVNFYIYTFYNEKFRQSLYSAVIKPFQSFVGQTRRTISNIVSLSDQATVGSSDNTVPTVTERIPTDSLDRLPETSFSRNTACS